MGYCTEELLYATGKLYAGDLTEAEGESIKLSLAMGLYDLEGQYYYFPLKHGGPHGYRKRWNIIVGKSGRWQWVGGRPYAGGTPIAWLFKVSAMGTNTNIPIAIRYDKQWYSTPGGYEPDRALTNFVCVKTHTRRKEWLPLNGVLYVPHAIAKAAYEWEDGQTGDVVVDYADTAPYQEGNDDAS